MPNTKIEYMYRDASNYKTWRTIRVKGVITLEQIQPCLAAECDGTEFIPSQVGLEDIQKDLASYPSGDDHVWHQLLEVKPTYKVPNVKLTANKLLKNFQARKGNWDVAAAVKLHGF